MGWVIICNADCYTTIKISIINYSLIHKAYYYSVLRGSQMSHHIYTQVPWFQIWFNIIIKRNIIPYITYLLGKHNSASSVYRNSLYCENSN